MTCNIFLILDQLLRHKWLLVEKHYVKKSNISNGIYHFTGNTGQIKLNIAEGKSDHIKIIFPRNHSPLESLNTIIGAEEIVSLLFAVF
ncbi:hypothetical protein Dfri01_09220 [Dyadobacter frigoris]|nr:hypothetical protein Dfri01_09220 [Dyadobacter frigoris]